MLSPETGEEHFHERPDCNHYGYCIGSYLINYKELAVVVSEEDSCFNKEVQPGKSDCPCSMKSLSNSYNPPKSVQPIQSVQSAQSVESTQPE